MKTKIMGVVTVVLVLGIAHLARATLVDSNSIVQDGIEYYIQTDKFVYDLGQNVEMLYKVINLGEGKVTFTFPHSPVWQFWFEKDGEQIWSAINYRLAIYTDLTLMPGELIEFPDFRPPFIWNMRDYRNNLVDLGKYNVIGGLYDGLGYYDYTKVTVSLEIVPEPSSFLFLVFGIFGIRAKHRIKCHQG
jgi:hypothetical protein